VSALDNAIWRRGIHNARRNPPDERDFLRGLHDLKSLTTLARLIASKHKTAMVRVKSSWIDKQPQTYPRSGQFNVELGDLLIITRVRALNRASGPAVGWILQGKRTEDGPLFDTHVGSTPKELALYESPTNWDFELKNGTLSIGQYDISRDPDVNPAIVPVPSATHWHYLLFRKFPLTSSAAWSLGSPIQWVWPRTAGASNSGSFSAAIVDSTTRPQLGKGVILDSTRNPEWTRLCLDLVRLTRRHQPGRLPGGPWHISTLYSYSVPSRQTITFLAALDQMQGPPEDGADVGSTDGEGAGLNVLELDVVYNDGENEPGV
jgi:hypothetical protein